ncbi:MAG: FKBP-type peptidyl-prolyl cis-trans isomerase [Alkalispirochaetaceae bacterium]
MKVEKNKVVSINYTLTDDSGEVLDSSEGGEPLAYLHGQGNLIPGLETELEGKSEGDNFRTAIDPADGYGEYNDALIAEVPRDRFTGVDEINVGMEFQAQTSDGGSQIVRVTEVSDEAVKVDANHPLAGQTLHFDVTVAGVRDATEEELEHGHVHD